MEWLRRQMSVFRDSSRRAAFGERCSMLVYRTVSTPWRVLAGVEQAPTPPVQLFEPFVEHGVDGLRIRRPH
jgi:hypothetical protein